MTQTQETQLNENGKTFAWTKEEALSIADEYAEKYNVVVTAEDISANDQNITWLIEVL